MQRWLNSISKLDYPANLLMVDNSPDANYIERVKKYCRKYGVKNYEIVHIDVPSIIIDEKLAQSREVIRQKVLNEEYEAWFSLECDVVVPSNALTKLVEQEKKYKKYWMISHTYPSRTGKPGQFNAEFGCSLIKRKALEKFGFINQYGNCDPLATTQNSYGNDVWYIVRLRRANNKYIAIENIIKPIYHLNEQTIPMQIYMSENSPNN